ncbi:NADP-dependent oxidoreductase [Sphaerisporangium sp. TRM90804]|uniref:NADP-dependent oxidoreductase n=1 Tax=Sphaerisporangium sp. TRM90804 TaxID=3031113 RepID=UPI00244CC1B4|nr:NADP-dependent oxidoreductase [Sphaerisporangium sp. TRM90804]MDH2430704.1 NADP-dependent oxidoreductase [Sphaerisporangium sp. TRM90804]
MRAAAFATYGGPEVLRVMELDTPQAGPGEVRVRVRAAGVQPYDLAVRAGWIPSGASGELPGIPGNEFAGVVDQVGAGVSGVTVGAEVLGFGRTQAYAEYVVVAADQVAAKPAGVPWEVAGALTAAVQTAELAVDTIGLGRGDTLLVHAAAGAVGGAAVQIARMRGAEVVGTARPENHDYLRDLGAVPVEYGDGLVERVRAAAPRGVDAALDGAGGAALDASLELVKDRDRIVTLVEHTRASEVGVRTVQGERSAERLARYARLYSQGDLKFLIRRAYPLAQAADAHRDVETGHGRGKVVITID